MIKIAQTGFMAAKNFGKKHFATAVKSMKEMKAKVKMPNKSSFKSFGGKAKAFGTKHKVALVAGGGAAGTVAGYQSGKVRERKRAIKGMHGMQLATAARELGISGPAKATSRSQRIAILKKANKNIRRQRSDFRSFWS